MDKEQQFFKGYIEGYFGRELSWEQRHGIVEHLASLQLNTYLYAPKEDPYHRLTWKKQYPASWCTEFKDLYEHGQQGGVQVIPSLAPGLSYNYTSEEDYQLLLEKCRLYFSMDVHHIALLMDDIDLSLPSHSQEAFSSLGEAHGKLLARLLRDLISECEDLILWFCPSVYSDQFVSGKAIDCQYIKDLHEHMPDEVTLMWTGPKIISENINQENCGEISALFNRNIVFWDNLYANDYAPLRLFLGSFQGRDPEFLEDNCGIMINPTGLFHTDCFLLSLFQNFLLTGDSSEGEWNLVAKEYELPQLFTQVKAFFWLPYTEVSEELFEPGKIQEYGDLYNDLIVAWVHPLKIEWFPYLQGLYLDLVYLSQTRKDDGKWLNQRYPAVIAKKMGA